MVALGKLLFLTAQVASLPAVDAVTTHRTAMTHQANPIRKVVNLLQAMGKKVAEEGEEAESLYVKFMCYCKTSSGDLSAGVEAAQAKIPELEASIKGSGGKTAQLNADLKVHKADRKSAGASMSEATGIREKEKAEFDKFHAEATANLDATRKAVAALENGMSGSFLQTQAGSILKRAVQAVDLSDSDHQTMLSFLSGQQGEDSAPASGEIVGILKQMVDEMASDKKDLEDKEKTSVETYDALIAAKKKEVSALTKSIETKMNRVGELGVALATLKNDLEDTQESLGEDQAFAFDMKKNCASKTGMHEKDKTLRAEEVKALAETVDILNSDDALELFKKTLPSASSSFMQLQESSSAWRSRARSLLSGVAKRGNDHRRMNFIMLALHGKKVGFEKIIKLVDKLAVTLKSEQVGDDEKKEYCATELDTSDDKKKELERSLSDTETIIAESKEAIAKLTEEIAALNAGIIALDKSVAEATAQRKAENAQYKKLMASDTSAKEILVFAKNRLAKFYTPKLAKAEEDSDDAAAFVQLSSRKDAPPPPPATANAYKKKGEENGGVIAMVNLLVSDLDKEMIIAKTEEENAQEDYEKTIAESAEKRTQDSKTLTDKEGNKADLDTALGEAAANKKSSTRDLMAVKKYISSLHGECDWLVKYFEVRKAARADEIDALDKAKAVLSGADYSLMQVGQTARTRKFLRHQV